MQEQLLSYRDKLSFGDRTRLIWTEIAGLILGTRHIGFEYLERFIPSNWARDFGADFRSIGLDTRKGRGNDLIIAQLFDPDKIIPYRILNGKVFLILGGKFSKQQIYTGSKAQLSVIVAERAEINSNAFTGVRKEAILGYLRIPPGTSRSEYIQQLVDGVRSYGWGRDISKVGLELNLDLSRRGRIFNIRPGSLSPIAVYGTEIDHAGALVEKGAKGYDSIPWRVLASHIDSSHTLANRPLYDRLMTAVPSGYGPMIEVQDDNGVFFLRGPFIEVTGRSRFVLCVDVLDSDEITPTHRYIMRSRLRGSHIDIKNDPIPGIAGGLNSSDSLSLYQFHSDLVVLRVSWVYFDANMNFNRFLDQLRRVRTRHDLSTIGLPNITGLLVWDARTNKLYFRRDQRFEIRMN